MSPAATAEVLALPRRDCRLRHRTAGVRPDWDAYEGDLLFPAHRNRSRECPALRSAHFVRLTTYLGGIPPRYFGTRRGAAGLCDSP